MFLVTNENMGLCLYMYIQAMDYRSCGPWKRACLKGIKRAYGLCIIRMPGFIWARKKGAVFVGGEKRCGLKKSEWKYDPKDCTTTSTIKLE